MTIDITQASTWVPLVGGVIVPFLVVLLTRYHASGWQKSVVAALLLGLTALGTYLVDVNQSHTWRGAATAFVLAMFAAAGSRVTITGGADTKLARLTPNFGLVGPTLAPADVAVIKAQKQ